MPSSTRAFAIHPEDPKVPVLEVRQIWQDVVLDTQHFRPSTASVHVGDRLGWRWELLGVDMGFVPEPMHRVLPWLPPIWSDVQMRPYDAFAVDADALGGADRHELFRFDEDRWLAMPPGGEPVALGPETTVIELGEIRFEVRVVAASRRTARVPWAVDATLAASTGVMAGIGLCFGILVALAPPPAEISVLEEDDHGAMALLRLPPPAPKKEEPKVVDEAEEPASTSKQPRSDRGPRHRDRPERGGNRGLRNEQIQEARSAGIFAGGGLDAILGADSALSAELVAATGVMFAKGEGGSGIGVNGLGDRRGGLGSGGGVDGLGDVGIWGPGGPPGSGDGDGLLGGEKEMRGPGTVASTPILIGNLTRDQVDRVVKGHLNAIRYCYQRELTRNPGLGGKLSIRFTIASDGTVSAAKATSNTLQSDLVEQCVVGRFLRMQFPEPSGGGIAVVTYPFVFAPG